VRFCRGITEFMRFIGLLILLFSIFLSCQKYNDREKGTENHLKSVEKEVEPIQRKPFFTVKVIRKIPHDPEAFTQGLFFVDGYLYESTGQYGKSSLRKINPENGEIVKRINFDSRYFCEGIAHFNDKIYVLTWQNNTCLVLDFKTFRKLKEIFYPGEGWGLTNYDESHLVQSDGTNILKVIRPDNFAAIKTIMVAFDGEPIGNLNELELIEGDIWANVWMKDSIVVIDKVTGDVKFWIDISNLRHFVQPMQQVDVLNGIAYDSRNKRIYLTGKFWPYIFEVEITNM